MEVRADVDRSDAIRCRCRGQSRRGLSLHLDGKWEEKYKAKDSLRLTRQIQR